MDERGLRGLIDQVKAGGMSRRAFVRRMAAVGLTAPMATQLLAFSGVAMAQTRSVYKPTKRGGGGLLRLELPLEILDRVPPWYPRRRGDPVANAAAVAVSERRDARGADDPVLLDAVDLGPHVPDAVFVLGELGEAGDADRGEDGGTFGRRIGRAPAAEEVDEEPAGGLSVDCDIEEDGRSCCQGRTGRAEGEGERKGEGGGCRGES